MGGRKQIAIAVLAAAALASAPICAPAWGQSAPKWLPYLDFEGKAGTKRNLGVADLFAPLAQNADTLLFADVRGRFADDDTSEGNLGFGIRHMLASGWNLGAYGYVDRQRTAFDNYFNQATFGVEALGRDYDLRANLYAPFGDRVKNVDAFNTAFLSGTTVFFQGGEERALRGFDAEVGWRVPIWSAEANKALRVYAGGYRFDDDVVRTVVGPRLRAELTLYEVPHLWEGTRLTLGAEYEHDDVRGSRGFAMVRLSVPLGLPGRAPPKLTPQERRMTERVVRDVDVVTEAGTFGAPEQVTQLANGTTFSVINSASTSGNNLHTAVAAAGLNSTVILNGTFQVTAGNSVSLAGGQTLLGGLIQVRDATGRVATLSSPATISGTNLTPALVQVNFGGTLSGLTITSAYSGGAGGLAVLVADGAGNVKILNNTITATQSGANGAAALVFGNNTSGIVTGNTLTATGSGPATSMTALSINNGATAVTVAGNTIGASGGTTNRMANVSGATIQPGSTANVRGSGACVGVPTSGFIGFTDGTTCP